MMKRILALAALAMTVATPAYAQRLGFVPTSRVDFNEFEKLTEKVQPVRQQRLLPFDQFRRETLNSDVLLLDARSADAFQRGHIKGAVNLPLTDFTAESLAQVIGDNPNRPIYIYCNNNFSNDRTPVMLKAPRLALNIQTFINLVGYGYPNVWELGDTVDFTDPKVDWVRD